MTTSAEWENPPMRAQFASPIGWVDEKGYPVATKEPINQPLLGIDIKAEGAIIIRYVNGEGQRVTLDLTAIIEEKVEAGIAAHMEKYHGHQI